MASELISIFVASVRDAYIQVSAFVAATVLLFSYVQYRSRGALVDRLASNRAIQPLAGALLGLTPGCGGAIVMMPLYVRGTVSFGTVVSTLVATAGDSAFVILTQAPLAAVVSYAIAFASAVGFGYAIDAHGLGVERVDRAMRRLRPALSHGGRSGGLLGGSSNPAHDYRGTDVPVHTHDEGPDRSSPILTPLSHVLHVLWWVTAAGALVLGVSYLLQSAPEVPLRPGLDFAGLFTVVGIAGTSLSLYLYLVGRHYIGEGRVGHGRESFGSTYDTLTHAAMETSFVTVWVVAAYLLYEVPVTLFGIDVASAAAAAGVLAPVAGALVGLIPGCGPQIVLAEAYVKGAVPFSTLTANAISQDGDALFPLLAVDPRAAIVASIYTTVPAIVAGVALHYLWSPAFGLASFGFGVLGG